MILKNVSNFLITRTFFSHSRPELFSKQNTTPNIWNYFFLSTFGLVSISYFLCNFSFLLYFFSDFCAHICNHFYTSTEESTSVDLKIDESLSAYGPPIIQGDLLRGTVNWLGTAWSVVQDPFTTVSVTIFLYFNLYKKPLFTENVGHNGFIINTP